MNKTISYYNANALSYIKNTQNANLKQIQDLFLSYLKGPNVLDFGCGSGRDTKYFLEKNFNVTAIDGSSELCHLASLFTGIEVRQMYFQELNDCAKYDGIWACSSILHLNKNELIDVFNKMSIALKEHGIIYTSFKCSEFEGYRQDRYFTDFTQESFECFIQNLPFHIEKIWITEDKLIGRENIVWLNVIMKKK